MCENCVVDGGEGAWVYVLIAHDDRHYSPEFQQEVPCKIGITSASPFRRAHEIQAGNPLPLVVFAAMRFDSKPIAQTIEASLLKSFQKQGKRLVGEWVNGAPMVIVRSIAAVAQQLGHPVRAEI